MKQPVCRPSFIKYKLLDYGILVIIKSVLPIIILLVADGGQRLYRLWAVGCGGCGLWAVGMDESTTDCLRCL